MTEDTYRRARIVRHCLTAWMLLVVAFTTGTFQHAGWVLPPLFALLGMVATGRVALHGYWRQSLVLGILLLMSTCVRPALDVVDKDSRRLTGMGLWDTARQAYETGRLPTKRQGEEISESPLRPPLEAAPESPALPPAPEGIAPVDRIARTESIPPHSSDFKREVLGQIGEMFGARESNDWPKVRDFYADSARYRGELHAGIELRRALEGDVQYWPTRRESLKGEMKITGDPDEEVVASFRTVFDYQNGDHHRLVGHHDHQLSLTPVGHDLKISQHSVSEAVYPGSADKWARPVAVEVQKFLLGSLDIEASGEFESLSGLYAEQVEYFGRLLSQAQVVSDKREYAARWPKRMVRLLGSPEISTNGNGGFGAIFPTAFRVESPSRNEWRTGIVRHTFSVVGDPGAFRITEENGDVTITGKGSLKSNKESDE